MPSDNINHPTHYTSHPSGIECIQITEHMSFNLGNAMKYVWRADLKNDALEDLKKAMWYLNREIAKRERMLGESARAPASKTTTKPEIPQQKFQVGDVVRFSVPKIGGVRVNLQGKITRIDWANFFSGYIYWIDTGSGHHPTFTVGSDTFKLVEKN